MLKAEFYRWLYVAGYCAGDHGRDMYQVGGKEKCIQSFGGGGKPEGKRPLLRPRRRWEENIKMDLQEVGWEGMDWIKLVQERDRWQVLVNAAMNLRVS